MLYLQSRVSQFVQDVTLTAIDPAAECDKLLAIRPFMLLFFR